MPFLILEWGSLAWGWSYLGSVAFKAQTHVTKALYDVISRLSYPSHQWRRTLWRVVHGGQVSAEHKHTYMSVIDSYVWLFSVRSVCLLTVTSSSSFLSSSSSLALLTSWSSDGFAEGKIKHGRSKMTIQASFRGIFWLLFHIQWQWWTLD